MLKIITAPHQLLHTPVKPVKNIDEKIKHLVFEMEKTLMAQTNPPGVGLAAPQVGKNLALFIVKPTKKAKTMVFINPKIVEFKTIDNRVSKVEKHPLFTLHPQNPFSTLDNLSSKKQKNRPLKLEGCLSIPRIWGPIKRADQVLVEFQDLSGKTQKKWFEGMVSIIIQHEIDHLNGILFTQKALEQNQILYEEKNNHLEKINNVK